jgi:thiol-disulfide isomerase/thioredoxin
MSVTVYYFSSPTCAPCKQIKHAIEELKEDYDTLRWVSVNTVHDPGNYATQFGVTVVPTVVVAWTESGWNTPVIGRHSGTDIAGYHRILRKGLASAQTKAQESVN